MAFVMAQHLAHSVEIKEREKRKKAGKTGNTHSNKGTMKAVMIGPFGQRWGYDLGANRSVSSGALFWPVLLPVVASLAQQTVNRQRDRLNQTPKKKKDWMAGAEKATHLLARVCNCFKTACIVCCTSWNWSPSRNIHACQSLDSTIGS